MTKPVKCTGRCCLLDFIYPHSDASLACDSECHFEHEGKENEQWYIDHFREKIELFNNAVKAETNGQ